MNAVRIPVDVADSERSDFFPELTRLVRRAHDTELLVVLVAREAGAATPSAQTTAFWKRCAAAFRDDPNVLFDLFTFPNAPSNAEWAAALNPLIAEVRRAGATQPVIAMRPSFEGITELLDDPSVVYEAAPRETDARTDRERDAQFGHLAERAPVIAAGWDLPLADAHACRAVPEEPGAATALVQNTLNYYDAHDVGWTVSVFEPGRLVKDLADHDGTSLENGWTCGRVTYPAAGIGRVVQAHLRAAEERGLYVVGAAGGLDVPRGGFAIAYGPAMAKRDAHAAGPRLPLHLAGIAVQVTDSKGVTRPAGILYTSAGWGQMNFVIPDESATGPARMTIVRDDGSRTAANITITDTAPGLWTGVSCRGAASGYALATHKPISACVAWHCKTLPVSVAAGPTRVLVRGSGFRHAASAEDIEVTLAGVRVRVVSFGPTSEPGIDQVVLEIPATLRGVGEADLIVHIRGRVSNPVRLHVG
jgi:uncharacterized protein (TIGR03437 family)